MLSAVGLLVAEGAKLRLWLNTVYVKAHVEYVPYKYEQAADVVDNIGLGVS